MPNDNDDALLAEVARLREENAALKVSVDGARSEAERIANLVHPTRAALGRAHAALRRANDNNADARAELCGAWAWGPGSFQHEVDAILADPEGRAAGEYVAALESEHEAATYMHAPDADPNDVSLHQQAHAAVEARRAGKQPKNTEPRGCTCPVYRGGACR